MPIATSFLDYESLYWHYRFHGRDFGCVDETDYLNQCLAFLNADRSIHTDIQECERESSAEIIRFNAVNDYFAVMDTGGIIKTFYKPVPISRKPVGFRGITHPFHTNQEYFEENCKR